MLSTSAHTDGECPKRQQDACVKVRMLESFYSACSNEASRCAADIVQRLVELIRAEGDDIDRKVNQMRRWLRQVGSSVLNTSVFLSDQTEPGPPAAAQRPGL